MSQSLQVVGGRPPYTLTSATVPAGVSAAMSTPLGPVLLTGTPTGAGLGPGTSIAFLVAVTVQDAAGATATFEQTITITVHAVVATIDGGALPDATDGVAYSHDVDATGGTGGYTFTKQAGPTWLSVNSSTGALTGTPGSGDVGTGITVTIRATDSEGNYGEVSDTMDVLESPYIDDFVTPFRVWSATRKLISTYSGPLLRVLRDSDSVQTDIGFDASGDLDTSALLAFAGSASLYVLRIYDQMGVADLTASGDEPRIVNAGVIETDIVQHDGLNDSLQASLGASGINTGVVTVFMRARVHEDTGASQYSVALDAAYNASTLRGFTIYSDDRTLGAGTPGAVYAMSGASGGPYAHRVFSDSNRSPRSAMRTHTVRFDLTTAATGNASAHAFLDGSDTDQGYLTDGDPTGTFNSPVLYVGSDGVANHNKTGFRSLVIVASDALSARADIEALL